MKVYVIKFLTLLIHWTIKQNTKHSLYTVIINLTSLELK